MAVVLASTENMSYEDWLEHRNAVDQLNRQILVHIIVVQMGGNHQRPVPADYLVDHGKIFFHNAVEHRKLGIGGSDASVVCGINKYKSPVELWMDKTGFSSSYLSWE